MQETESTNFSEWMASLTVTDAVNILLMTVFIIVIVWLVIRTFRGKSSA
ncbi:MAG: hypothetical protein ABJG47_17690 [Ekhidna sp.]